MQQLREMLDVVEIVMGFLSSGAVKADIKLEDYVKTALQMQDKFISKKVSFCACVSQHNTCIWVCIMLNCVIIVFIYMQASEHCQLKHVLSLWETLSVELAKKHTLIKQVQCS